RDLLMSSLFPYTTLFRSRGLKFDTVYTLVETAAPNGYVVAESIKFKLRQRKDENGDLLNEADVYICTGRDWLIFDHWEKLEDGIDRKSTRLNSSHVSISY